MTKVMVEIDTVGTNIGGAVAMLRSGNKVRRAGWNGKGMFLILVPGSQFEVTAHRPMGVALPDRIGTRVEYQEHVDMYTAQGTLVPWLCSQSDLLAIDWEMA